MDNLRDKIRIDLIEYIRKHKSKEHDILLCIDRNEPHSFGDSEISKLLDRTQMIDPIVTRHGLKMNQTYINEAQREYTLFFVHHISTTKSITVE